MVFSLFSLFIKISCLKGQRQNDSLFIEYFFQGFKYFGMGLSWFFQLNKMPCMMTLGMVDVPSTPVRFPYWHLREGTILTLGIVGHPTIPLILKTLILPISGPKRDLHYEFASPLLKKKKKKVRCKACFRCLIDSVIGDAIWVASSRVLFSC